MRDFLKSAWHFLKGYLQQHLSSSVIINSTYNIFGDYMIQPGFIGLLSVCIILFISLKEIKNALLHYTGTLQQIAKIVLLAMIIAGMTDSFIHHLQAQCMFAICIFFCNTKLFESSCIIERKE